MRQQMAHRDRRLRRAHVGKGTVGGDLHLHGREFGQDRRNRLIQTQLALVDQHHRDHAGDRLGHRIGAIQAVDRGRARIAQRLHPAHDLALAVAHADQRDDAGQFAAIDIAGGHRSDMRVHQRRIGRSERDARHQRGAPADKRAAQEITSRNRRLQCSHDVSPSICRPVQSAPLWQIPLATQPLRSHRQARTRRA